MPLECLKLYEDLPGAFSAPRWTPALSLFTSAPALYSFLQPPLNLLQRSSKKAGFWSINSTLLFTHFFQSGAVACTAAVNHKPEPAGELHGVRWRLFVILRLSVEPGESQLHHGNSASTAEAHTHQFLFIKSIKGRDQACILLPATHRWLISCHNFLNLLLAFQCSTRE